MLLWGYSHRDTSKERVLLWGYSHRVLARRGCYCGGIYIATGILARRGCSGILYSKDIECY